MTVVYVVSLALLAAAAVVAVTFVIRVRGLVDRAVGLDVCVSILANGLAVAVAVTAGGDTVDLVLLIGLLAFLGNVTIARFVERRGSQGEGTTTGESP